MVVEAGSARASPFKLVEAAACGRKKSQDGKNETKKAQEKNRKNPICDFHFCFDGVRLKKNDGCPDLGVKVTTFPKGA